MSGPIKEDFSLFLKNGAFWIAFAVVIIILISIGVFMCLNFRKKKEVVSISNNDLYIALGGKENIKEEVVTGSRHKFVLNDKSLLDKEKLKTLGVSSVIEMADAVTLVIR